MKPIHHFKPTFKVFKEHHETCVLTNRKSFAFTWQWCVLRLFNTGRPHCHSCCVLSSVTTTGRKWVFNKTQACSIRLWLDGFSCTNQQITDTKNTAQLSHLASDTVLPQCILSSGMPVQPWDLRNKLLFSGPSLLDEWVKPTH